MCDNKTAYTGRDYPVHTRILDYAVAYGMASAFAYGLYWIGGGEGRSFGLACVLGASWVLATAVLSTPEELRE